MAKFDLSPDAEGVPNGYFYAHWLRQVTDKIDALHWWNWRQRKVLTRSRAQLIYDMSRSTWWGGERWP